MQISFSQLYRISLLVYPKWETGQTIYKEINDGTVVEFDQVDFLLKLFKKINKITIQ